MKTIYLLAIMALLPALGIAQELTPAPPAMLTVETSITNLDKTVITLERCEVSIEGELLGVPTETETSRRQDLQPVAMIVASEAATVTAFDSNFAPQSVGQISDTKFYLAASPGRYLLLVNTGAKSAVAVAVIPAAEPVPDPVDPVEPPPSDVSVLAKLSADLANRINDQPTRERLAASLARPIESDNLEAAQNEIQWRIRDELKKRPRGTDSPWLIDWRQPIQKEIQRLGVTTLSDYAAAIKAVADGLLAKPEGSTESSGSLGIIPVDTTTILSALQPDPQYELVPVLTKRCRPDGTCYQAYEYHRVLKE